MSKVRLLRDTRLGNLIIPEGTKLIELGDGPAPGLTTYELPIILAAVTGQKTIDLYAECDVLPVDLAYHVD